IRRNNPQIPSMPDQRHELLWWLRSSDLRDQGSAKGKTKCSSPECWRRIPGNLLTIGNHEFNGGIEGLAPFLAALRAPVLVANIDNRHETSLDGLYTPHIVLKRNGRKIGLIGVSTVESKSSSRTGNLIFLDPVKVVTDEAKSLTERGVDIIVVLSHCGLEVDK
ncbi:Apyrase, partial [Operophtera brumata]